MNMYEKRILLRELLAEPECTPIMGAYDVLSAKIIENAGTSGIHIEDNLFGKHSKCQQRMIDVEVMCDQVRAPVGVRMAPNFMIVARTDAYVVTKDIDETVEHLQAYLDAGADVVGAQGAGMATCHINRAGAPWTRPEQPDVSVQNLHQLQQWLQMKESTL